MIDWLKWYFGDIFLELAGTVYLVVRYVLLVGLFLAVTFGASWVFYWLGMADIPSGILATIVGAFAVWPFRGGRETHEAVEGEGLGRERTGGSGR